MFSEKPSVLACVTSQFECDRIIKTAEQIALSDGCELRVLSVLKPMTDYTSVSDRIEYLNRVSRESGADMTILFHNNAPMVCARFAIQNNVQRIVAGMHDGGEESFLVMFNRLAPEVSITMVSENGEIYNMDVVQTAVR